jgi:hypothetical protein
LPGNIEIEQDVRHGMALRIRCPQCRTVQRVPAGIRPVCPKCGFAGNSAAAGTDTQWAQPAADVSWETAPAPTPGAEGGEGAAAEGWSETSWPQSDAPAEPKKKGWFGKSK